MARIVSLGLRRSRERRARLSAASFFAAFLRVPRAKIECPRIDRDVRAANDTVLRVTLVAVARGKQVVSVAFTTILNITYDGLP